MKRLLASASLAALALAAPLAPPVLPFAATAAMAQGAVTLENLSFKSESATVSIPRLIVEGSAATKAEIEALFDAKAMATLADRLSRLSAASVTIPTIEVTQTLPEATGVSVYRNTVMRGVRNGVVGEATTESFSTSVKPGAGAKDAPAIEMTSGAMTLKGMDLPLWLRVVFDRAEAGETMKVALAEQTVSRLTYRIGGVATVNIAEVTGKDFKIRRLKTPLVEMIAQAERQAKSGQKPDEKASMAMAVDILSAMSVGDMRLKGLSGEATPPGKPTVRFGMDQMAMAGGGDVPGRFQMQGLKVANGPDMVNIGEVAVEGVSLASMMGALTKLADAQSGGMSDIDPAAMIPKIDVVRLSGIDIDVPDAKNPQQRIKAKLGLFETKMANHVNSIPADIAIAIDRLQMDIPANTKEKGLQDILALGYKALDVSARYDQSWNEAGKTLRLNELSLRSAGMFSASAKAEIVNVPRELFTLDKAVASVAALGVAAKSVQVRLVNDTLFEKLIAKQAREARRKVEDVRAELAAGATMMAPMFLGDHPAAKAIGTALGRFVAEPKSLNVAVTAKGDGIGATDFIAVSNPMELLKKVDIQAAANQ